MADVRSKNVYELLGIVALFLPSLPQTRVSNVPGNDPELDPNREPEPPTRALDRPVPRIGKREAPKEPPTQPDLSGSNARRGGRPTGNEAAFRDRNAGTLRNREKPVDEGKEPQRRGFNARDDRGGRVRNDRQSRTGVTDTRKQIKQSWGVGGGQKEWDDERAGEDIAQRDENEPQTPGEEGKEPVDLTKSFAAYQAEKAAQGDLSAKPVRVPNEGNKADKQWAGAKQLKRDEEEQQYIKGKEEKAKREKQRKEKNVLEVDLRFVEPPRGANGPRGGRGGAPRGRGVRGGGRGGRGNGSRGGGGGGAAGPTVDEKNFPSLGS
ncbi:hypothetical protein PHISP_03020 [Aspergillus sp. HF37]|nr:hypothetical protein PHISP_03020 [Aspergillus sp. HF37]